MKKDRKLQLTRKVASLATMQMHLIRKEKRITNPPEYYQCCHDSRVAWRNDLRIEVPAAQETSKYNKDNNTRQLKHWMLKLSRHLLPSSAPILFPDNDQYGKSGALQTIPLSGYWVAQPIPDPCQRASQQQFESIHQDQLKWYIDIL